MRKIFNEYGGWAVIVFVIAVLLLLVGGIKSIDDNGKVKGTGLASIVGNTYSDVIDKFKNHYNDAMAIKSGPNGEPLVSTTESQVGKYADIDSDGTVDGIIFADLAVGGSGTWNDETSKDTIKNGSYSIPVIPAASLKKYYVSQKNYTNKFCGTAEVITSIGNGEDRFYIMALNNVSGQYTFYNSAYGKMNDYKSSISQNFGKGKYNTNNMIKKWNSKTYGKQNTNDTYNDAWSKIQTEVNNGLFVPSREEWAAFAGQLGLTKSNYSAKGIPEPGCYWTSSQSDVHLVYGIHFHVGRIDANDTGHVMVIRLATTF